jgi:uncharacterized protein
VFDDPNAVSFVNSVADGETRWTTIGMAGGVVVILVVHTVDESYETETIRIISARKANRSERDLYQTAQ